METKKTKWKSYFFFFLFFLILLSFLKKNEKNDQWEEKNRQNEQKENWYFDEKKYIKIKKQQKEKYLDFDKEDIKKLKILKTSNNNKEKQKICRELIKKNHSDRNMNNYDEANKRTMWINEKCKKFRPKNRSK